MQSKVKIKISEKAYDELVRILKESYDDSFIRFSYKDGCCKSSKVELFIDNYRLGDTKDTIDNLPLIYDAEVIEHIKEITLVYRNSSFMIKTIPVKEQIKNCSTCKVGCGNKGNCANCK